MIRKAVIPAAGMGTRFLPATKAQPKEMLPIIDTPTIQFVVQEAVDSGIHDILIITGKGKRAIEDHFDRNFELEMMLENRSENHLFNEIRRTADMANIHFIRQKELIGLGDAVLCARDHIGDEPFAVLLGDTIVDSVIPVTRQLIDSYVQYRRSIVAVEEVPREKVIRYGIVSGEKVSDTIHEITTMVEKPSVETSPSNLAIAGRYVLTPDIFNVLEKVPRSRNGEIQLTDALRRMLGRESVYSYTIEGKRYDIGNKLDYLKTQVEFGLKRREFHGPFLVFLKEVIENHGSE